MEENEDRLGDLRRRKSQAEAGGGSARVDAQHAKGKLTARERLGPLPDQNCRGAARRLRSAPPEVDRGSPADMNRPWEESPGSTG